MNKEIKIPKEGDLVFLIYVHRETGLIDSNMLLRVKDVKREPLSKFGFRVYGKILYKRTKQNEVLLEENDLYTSGHGYYNFDSYMIYDSNTPIESIIMLEDL